MARTKLPAWLAIPSSAARLVGCFVPVVESRRSYPIPIRRLGRYGAFRFLGMVAVVGCSNPIRTGPRSTGGAPGSGGILGAGGVVGSSGLSLVGGSFGAGGSGGSNASTVGPTGGVFGSSSASMTGGVVGTAGSTALPGNFTRTGSLTVARELHTATLLQNGLVLIAGGANGMVVASTELYDPGLGTFAATGSMTTTRASHTATLLPGGKVLIAGGEHTDNTNYQSLALASAELYDPATGTFTATGSMSTSRSDHTATLLTNGKVLIAGGESYVYYDMPTYNTDLAVANAELYDPMTGTFTATGSMSGNAGAGLTSTLLQNGKVLIAGGASVSGASFPNAELYDPAAGIFSATGNMTVARYRHTATLLPSGKVLITGGSGTPDLSSAEQYDPAAGTFTATSSMSVSRYFHTATLLPDGMVLVAGGWNDASAELYDPAAGAFTAKGNMTTARYRHTATLLASGSLIIVGGGASGDLASAELYQ